MNSLERRLQLGLSLSLVLLMGLLWWAGNRAVNQLAENFVSARLEHDAESLLAAVDFGPEGRLLLRDMRLTRVYQQPFSGHYFSVTTAAGETARSRSLWDQGLDIPSLATGSERLVRLPGPNRQHLLAWVGGYRKQDHEFTLGVAEDMTGIARDIQRYRLIFAGLLLAVVAVLLLVQRLVVRHALRRLETVRDDMRRLAEGEIRALDPHVPAEVLPLVTEFNRLLALLGERLERSRNALGNLAHALKGPLNLLLQAIDGPELRDRPETRRNLHAHAQRIDRLMQRELKRARLAGAGNPGQRFDPRLELPDLMNALRAMYRDKGLDLASRIYLRGSVPADREDVLELLGNLLDNACKWASSRVQCTVAGENGLELTVEDDGPGVSGPALERLAQRGVRMDENVDGHGLGLAIAQDIVRLYGGRLELGRSEALGGLRVRAFLKGRLDAV